MTLAIAISFGLAGQPLYERSEVELDAYLRQYDAAASFAERLRDVVHDSLGTPYHDGPLGEGPDGKYDADPLVDFSRVDCVTYVEQAIAAAATTNYDDMFKVLQNIRYKDGAIDYETRNHFLITDWTENNPFCLDVTKKMGVETETSTRTISRRSFFERVEAPGLGANDADRDVTLHYVPATAAAAAEPNIPSPSLIVFIGKVDWLFALHCGLYIRDESGHGQLYHASSKAGQVVGVSLTDYLADQTGRYLGFTVHAIEDPQP